MDNELYKDRLTWFTVVWALVGPIKLLLPDTLWASANTAKDRPAGSFVIRALLSPIKLVLSNDPWAWACIMVVSGIVLAVCWWHYFRAPESTDPASKESP